MAVYLVPDKTIQCNGVKVNQYLLTNHNVNNISMPLKRTKNLVGITIHNTDWIKVNSATTPAEQYTRATVNGNMNSVRVHYYVDDVCAWQNLSEEWQSWHAGQSGKADRNGSEAGNAQTISIECIMGGVTGYEKSEDNCARLVAYLLNKYNLTINNLYTHNYWCNIRNGKNGTVDTLNKTNDNYKNCPVYIRPHWDNFKTKVSTYLAKLNNTTTTTSNLANTSTSANKLPYLIKVIDKTGLNVRQNAGVNNPIVTTIKYGEIYTIVEEVKVDSATWGLLKAYKNNRNGYINIGEKYIKKV